MAGEVISWGHFQAAVDADLLAMQERVVDALTPSAVGQSLGSLGRDTHRGEAADADAGNSNNLFHY
jgi:hypothetical protein